MRSLGMVYIRLHEYAAKKVLKRGQNYFLAGCQFRVNPSYENSQSAGAKNKSVPFSYLLLNKDELLHRRHHGNDQNG